MNPIFSVFRKTCILSFLVAQFSCSIENSDSKTNRETYSPKCNYGKVVTTEAEDALCGEIPGKHLAATGHECKNGSWYVVCCFHDKNIVDRPSKWPIPNDFKPSSLYVVSAKTNQTCQSKKD